MKSHKQMQKENIKSPDKADALCLAYAGKKHPYCSATAIDGVMELNKRAVRRKSKDENMLTRQF
jgi:hypothetical protein